ncbi:hypothetical protein [Spiroplasma sp. AdecLV25b]|uniref:hypothetical protein n=1 Tax=Spiroplasma sp. AdecLV25b TaxID=3027162 RepID=UPI0027DFA0F3|nr:hypothetical protein [Spiroplasma sp. AdecLV25b]
MGILFKNKKFYWNFGTTSFRNKQLKENNIIILKELNSFWNKSLFRKWDNSAQEQFYKILMEKGITKGTAKN